MKKLSLLLILLFGIFSAITAQTVIYVNVNTGNDTNNGSSWAQAFKSLDVALAASSSGKQIWMAKGTYYLGMTAQDRLDPGYRDKSFILTNGVSIYGGFSGSETSLSQRDWVANPTVLSGWGGTVYEEDDYYHVVVVANVNNVTIDGIIIESGTSSGNGSSTINGQTIERNLGGGIFCKASSLKLNHVNIGGNDPCRSNDMGAALYVNSSTVWVANSVIMNNHAANTGAGITIFNASSLLMLNSTIASNTTSGGGVGAGIALTDGSFFTAYNSIIAMNSAGAASDIYAETTSGIDIRYCAFSDGNTIAGTISGTGVTTGNSFLFNSDGSVANAPNAVIHNKGNSALYDEASFGSVDFSNSPRTIDGTVDIGAFEYQLCVNKPTAEFLVSEMAFCAKNLPQLLTINYDSMGGSYVAPALYHEGDFATVAAAPTKDGFVFTEWNTKPDGSGIGYAPGSSFTMPSNSITLFAIFNVRQQHTITFDSQGGTFVPSAQYFSGDMATLPSEPFKPGLAFTGWNTSADGSGTSYSPGDSFIMPDHSLTIYATWALPESFTVSYDSMGGTTVASIQCFAGDMVTVSSGPFKPGFVFTGWNTHADGSGTLYLPNESFIMPPQHMTLYAMFVEALKYASVPTIPIKIGGSGVPPYQITYEVFVDNISQGQFQWIDIASSGNVNVPANVMGTASYKLVSITDGNGCTTTNFTLPNLLYVSTINDYSPTNGILYVNKNVAASGDGSSWNNAIKELADALYYTLHCGSGVVNEVWVAQGVYFPMYAPVAFEEGGNQVTEREATFYLPDNVKIYGGFTGNETSVSQRDWQTNVTTLSGDIGYEGETSDNIYHVVTAFGLTNTVLDGFSIEWGNANGAGSIAIGSESILQRMGGGICDFYSNGLRLKNLKIAFNEGIFAGGIYSYKSAAVYDRLSITDNYAMNAGGIYALSGSSILGNSIIARNAAEQNGGGLYYDGDNGYLINSTVVDNICLLEGSGLNHIAGSNLKIQNSIIWDNSYAGNTISINQGYPTIDFSIVDGYVGSDPMFVDPLGGDYRLQPSSAGINGGDNFLYLASGLLGNTDFAGNPRFSDSRVDIGAYETECKVTTEAVFLESEAVVCEGSSINLDVKLIDNGMGFNPPYIITYTIDNSAFFDTPPIWSMETTITVTPTQSGTVRLESIRDGRDCSQPLYRSSVMDITVLKASPTGGVLYVDKSVPTSGSGASWATAIKELADALQYAKQCGNGTVTEIRVAKGTYYPMYKIAATDTYNQPTIDRDKAFLIPSGVKLVGSYKGGTGADANTRDTLVYRSTLSGDVLGNDIAGSWSEHRNDNLYHVVVALATAGNITIDGFTIKSGYGDDSNSVSTDGVSLSRDHGAGVLMQVDNGSEVNLLNCNVKDNFSSYFGAGIGIPQSGGTQTINITNSNIYGNSASTMGGGIAADMNNSSSILIKNSIIQGNTASMGGGLKITSQGQTDVVDNTITHNTSQQGAGLSLDALANSTTKISNNTISNNTSSQGGGMHLFIESQSTTQVVNNLLANNSVDDAGGGIYANTVGSTTATSLLFTNNSVVSNAATNAAGGILVYAGSSPSVSINFNNNIIWGNTGLGQKNIDFQSGTGNTIQFNNNLIEGKTQANLTQPPYSSGGTNNLDGTAANPGATSAAIFGSFSEKNYRLASKSIALNKGNNSYINALVQTYDLDELPRITAGTVDLGAYEHLWGGLSLVNDTVAYDGSVHTYSKPVNGLSELASIANIVSIAEAKGANVGSYEHQLIVGMLNQPAVYPDIFLNAFLVITPAEITGLVFNNATYVYDGTAKSLAVGNLPGDATVVYTNNNQTEVGVYEVEATVSRPNHNDVTLKATLTITPGVIPSITFPDGTFEYDGTAKSIFVNNLPAAATATYIDNGKVNVGVYIVEASIVMPNHKDTTLTATLTITPATITGATFDDKTYIYDGTIKSLAVTGLPAGATVTYIDNDQTEIGSYLVEAFIKLANHHDLMLTATLTIEPREIPNIVFNDGTFEYDGTAKSIYVSNLPTGATATYIGNSRTDVGEYIVEASITMPNHKDTTLMATLTILPNTITNVTFSDKTYTYDGSVKSLAVEGLPSGATVTYIGNSKTNVGVYTVEATIKRPNSADLVLTATLTIEPARFNGLTFNDGVFTYDGTKKSIYVTGAPALANIVYNGNEKINVGTYTVMATITMPNYVDTAMVALLTIKPVSGDPYLGDATYVYDGSPKAIYVGNLPSGATVDYTGNGMVNVGTYPVTAVVHRQGLPDITLTATYTITPGTLAGIMLNDLTVMYDGTPKSILISYAKSSITVDYTGNGKVNVGSYPITAVVKKPNYNDLTLHATLTITPAVMTATMASKTFIFDGKPKSLTVVGAPDGASISFTGNGQTNVGSYPVTALIKRDNYYDLTLNATLSIEKASLTGVMLTDRVYVYDGTPKSLAISFAKSGITVDYTGNNQVNVGIYTVTAVVKKPNHNDLTLTAKLTITPATMAAELSSKTFVYDGQAKSLEATNVPAGATVTYTGNNQVNAGVYPVTAVVKKANYYDLTLNATLTIENGSLTGIMLNDMTYVYDGTPKSLSISFAKSGITVEYTGNNQVNVGSYTVVAVVKKPNYNDLILRARLVITPASLTATLDSKSFVYDGLAKSLEVVGAPSDATVTYTGNGQVNVGSYPVVAVVKKENYYDLTLDATLTITPAFLMGIVFEDAAVQYDGTPKSIYASNLPDGATVSYLGNEKVDVGVYTVTATVKKENYYDLITTATLTIYNNLLDKVIVDGNEHNVSQIYDAKCGSEQVHVQIVLKPGAVCNIATDTIVTISKPGIKEIPFTVVSADGKDKLDYVLRIERRFNFDDIIVQKWDNTFALNIAKLTADGYNFVSFNWYQFDAVLGAFKVVGTGTYYSAGENSNNLLNDQASYYAELVMADGTALHTCEKTPVLAHTNITAYPNPVNAGGVINVKSDLNTSLLNGATIQVYTILGSKVTEVPVAGAITQVPAPSTPGTYVLRLEGKGITRGFKIIVN